METDRLQLEKAAHELQLPVQEVVIFSPPDAPREYVSIFDVVRDLATDGLSYSEIYDEFFGSNRNPDLYSSLNPEDLVFVYLAVLIGSDASTFNEQAQFALELGDPRFPNGLSDIELYYTDFFERMNRARSTDEENFEKSQRYAIQLSEIDPLPFSEVIIDVITLEFKPVWKKTQQPPTLDQNLVLFNSTQLTNDITYLQFGQYFKVSTDYPEEPFSDSENKFIFRVWNGIGPKPADPNKEAITVGTYDLVSGVLSFRTPIIQPNQEKIMIDRIQAVFPDLDFGEPRETRIGGNFTISGLELQIPSLLHLILIDPLMNQYIYAEESLLTYADKSRLTLHYRSVIDTPSEETGKSYISNPSSVEISIKQITGSTIPTVEAKISKGENRAVIAQFVDVFGRLMNYYMQVKNPIISLYQTYIPQLQTGQMTAPVRRATSARKGTLLDQLKADAGEIFVANYARKCQAPQHPKIMTEKEAEAWTKETFVHNGQTYHRQAMRYPPPSVVEKGAPVHYFGCTSANHPFPGVIAASPEMENYSTYPYLPCCFKTDQMDPNVNSLYNVFFRGQVRPQRSEVKAAHLIKTDKFLSTGRTGTLPLVVQKLLSLAGGSPDAYVRIGVPQDPNSFLHSIGLALQDPEYLLDPQRRVLEYRSHLLATQYPGLYKQQLYDIPDSKIAEMIATPDYFFDPRLFYRGIEEMFGINVYVFVVPPGKDSSDETVTLELPRYSVFNIRYSRPERPTVLIFKHFGSESDGSTTPQCELIINGNARLFGPAMTNLLNSAQLDLYHFLTTKMTSELTTTDNFYSSVDIVRDFQTHGWIPTAQIIDPYGKCRGIVINGATLEIIPSMPLNLPTIDFPTPKKLTPAEVETLMGSISPDGWYPVLHENHGIYVPLEGTTTPFPTPEPKMLSDQKSDDLWIQIFYWLWMLNLNSSRPKTPTQFAKSYLILSKSPNYDLTQIDPILPIVDSVEAGISHLNSTLQYQGRLIVSRAVAEQIPKKLEEWGPNTIPTTLTGVYQSVGDFREQPGTTILIGNRDYKNWVRAQKSPETQPFPIVNKLETTGFLSEEPYYFANDSLYLIQNVYSGSFSRALNVAHTWRTQKINLGFQAPEATILSIPYVIKGISVSGIPVVIEDHTNGEPEYLEILNYGGISHAAMLKIT